jgi:hypothetical protein
MLELPYRQILRSNPSRPNTQANAHSCSHSLYWWKPNARLPESSDSLNLFFVMMTYGGVMDTNDIISQIDIEISNLQQARAILIGVTPAKKGRPESTDTLTLRRFPA